MTRSPASPNLCPRASPSRFHQVCSPGSRLPCWPYGEPAELTKPEVDPALLPPNAVCPRSLPSPPTLDRAATLQLPCTSMASPAPLDTSYPTYPTRTYPTAAGRTGRRRIPPPPSPPRAPKSARLPAYPAETYPADSSQVSFLTPRTPEPGSAHLPYKSLAGGRRSRPRPTLESHAYPAAPTSQSPARLPCGPLALHMHAREAHAYPTGVPARSRGLPCSPRSRTPPLTPPLQPQATTAARRRGQPALPPCPTLPTYPTRVHGRPLETASAVRQYCRRGPSNHSSDPTRAEARRQV